MELANFDTAFALCAGLDTPYLKGMYTAWAEVSTKHMNKLTHMRTLTSPESMCGGVCAGTALPIFVSSC